MVTFGVKPVLSEAGGQRAEGGGPRSDIPASDFRLSFPHTSTLNTFLFFMVGILEKSVGQMLSK